MTVLPSLRRAQATKPDAPLAGLSWFAFGSQ
jgi:hypothetical protein